MGRELGAIAARLRGLHAELYGRRPVVADESDHVLDMNPLTDDPA